MSILILKLIGKLRQLRVFFTLDTQLNQILFIYLFIKDVSKVYKAKTNIGGL